MEDKELKIILLGESGVGKTSIILRYYKNMFTSDLSSTFGTTYIKKSLVKNNVTYKLNIWDTTGQEHYHSVTELFINGSDIVILVYAINEVDSFKKLDYWFKSIRDNCDENIILAIVGNKYDLTYNDDNSENQYFVSNEEAKKYAKEKQAMFKLVSAKADQKGIDSLFDELVNEYIQKGMNKPSDNKDANKFKIDNVDNKKKKKKEKKGCC